MKNLKYKELVAYALSFVTFALPKINVDEIILFGSVARGEADEKSDIDLFFNIEKEDKKIKEKIKLELERFYKSKLAELWLLKGIKNPIKVEVGNLNKWKLKRSIISGGIVLYGKYQGIPEGKKGFVFFNLKPIKNIAKRNKIIRKLFGRKEKGYDAKGILETLGGKKLSATCFLVPIEKTKEILQILNSEKIDFTFFELWSDEVLS